MKPESTQTTATWYRAVTEDRPTEEVYANDQSFAVLSMSPFLEFGSAPSQIGQSWSGEVEGASSVVQTLKHTQNDISRGSSPWTRTTYPLQNSTDNPTPPQSPGSDQEEEGERSHMQLPDIDRNSALRRALRRTSKSQRLHEAALSPSIESLVARESRKQAAGTEQTTSLTDSAESNNSNIVLNTKPWKRQIYPLQSATTGSTTEHDIQSAVNGESRLATVSASGQHEQTRETLAQNKMWGRQDHQTQPSINAPMTLPASPPSSESGSGNEKNTPAQQTERASHGTGQPKPRKRRAYPLQAPASIANLRSSPTPPPSPKQVPEHLEASNADGEEHSSTKKSKALRRQAYPLQSPASIPALRLSQAPTITTEEELPKHDELSAPQQCEDELASKVISHWRRQVYPLQSPKSVSPFLQPPTPQEQEEAEKYDKPSPIHLPKNMRALKDVGKADPKGRTIVLCLDGTGDKFDNDNSSIVHLISALKKDDPHQVSYYQAGIGTYSKGGGLNSGFAAALDMAVGSSLGLHVREAYHFLMHTYKEGDKICIFGFSRGAYTARCLAGMIHKVGLLPPRNIQQIPFAYEFYKNDTPEGWTQSESFKETFCIDVCVYFLGCFDSVASVGFIPRELPLSTTPTNKPRYFRHAMSLDERRAKFKICRHQTKDGDDVNKKWTNSDLLQSLPNYKDQNDTPPKPSGHTDHRKAHHPAVSDEEYRNLTGHQAPFETDVLEVWFAGGHGDVGGGAALNEERHKLSQITLRWMIRQAFECNTGIIFKTRTLAEFGLDVHTLWPVYKKLSEPAHGPPPSFLEKYAKGLPPRSVRRGKLVPIDKHENGEHFYHLQSHKDEDWTPEQVEDFYDAMAPFKDQLVEAPSWWILEFWPVEYKVPLAPGEVAIRTGMNLGRYRGVEDLEPNLHWTVQHRMQHLGYKIRARTAAHTTWCTAV